MNCDDCKRPRATDADVGPRFCHRDGRSGDLYRDTEAGIDCLRVALETERAAHARTRLEAAAREAVLVGALRDARRYVMAASPAALTGEVRAIDVALANPSPAAVAMLEEQQRLRAVCESFADVAERAVAAHRAPRTGMQVPYHDDFANVAPSVVARLEWWAKRFREAVSK